MNPVLNDDDDDCDNDESRSLSTMLFSRPREIESVGVAVQGFSQTTMFRKSTGAVALAFRSRPPDVGSTYITQHSSAGRFDGRAR